MYDDKGLIERFITQLNEIQSSTEGKREKELKDLNNQVNSVLIYSLRKKADSSRKKRKQYEAIIKNIQTGFPFSGRPKPSAEAILRDALNDLGEL